MLRSNARKAGALMAIVFALAAARGDAAVFATYDATQHNLNGFVYADFSDFSDPVDTSGGVISIDIQTDFDSVNGLFGGMGSDIVAGFNAATTQLQVALTVDPLNIASDFRIVLTDDDGPDTGEQYQFFFDLSALTPGQPTLLTQSLLNPGPVFRQQNGANDGDMIQNYGLRQIQIQSAFGGTDRLKIDVESVQLVDPDDPLLIEFNTSTYAAQTQTFAFGTFQDPGALDTTGSTFIIDAAPAGPGGGGFGFNGLNLDFEATDYQIEIEAKLLPNNTATGFNLLLGDNDGDDSAPGLGSDDYIFTVDTADLNVTEFATVTIPLGTGTENGIEKTFGFTNNGDGLQNFDLTQMQIQAMADDTFNLGLEVLRFSIVERPPGAPGDFDNDGDIDGADFLVWQRGFGDGAFDADDLTAWQAAYGTTPPVGATASVPEPASCLLLFCAAAWVPIRRMPVRV